MKNNLIWLICFKKHCIAIVIERGAEIFERKSGYMWVAHSFQSLLKGNVEGSWNWAFLVFGKTKTNLYCQLKTFAVLKTHVPGKCDPKIFC